VQAVVLPHIVRGGIPLPQKATHDLDLLVEADDFGLEFVDLVAVHAQSIARGLGESRELAINSFMSETQHEVGIRPWGSYKVLAEEPKTKVKIITVKPKGKLSLQYHHYRQEHWYVVQGKGKLTLGNSFWTLNPGDHADIPLGMQHRIENIGEEDLIFVEVQTGQSFDENDIVRVEDDYGR
jgi:mannose-6-phosphate isomerase